MKDKGWRQTHAGIFIPKIIYGTAWKKERTKDLVIKAFKAGFRGIDTACQPRHYNEPLVGEALQAVHAMGFKRQDYHLQTKYTPVSGQAPNNIPYDPNQTITLQVAQSIEVSLKNLVTNYLDCFILHSPFAKLSETLEAWRAMEHAYRQGYCKMIGISNCYNLDSLKALFEQSEIKPSIVQNRFYNKTQFDITLRQWCTEKDIIYQSFWTLTANPQLLESPLILQMAQKYARTAPQILFGYLAQKQVVPLTGTTSLQHMAEDLASVGMTYSSKELEALDSLLDKSNGAAFK